MTAHRITYRFGMVIGTHGQRWRLFGALAFLAAAVLLAGSGPGPAFAGAREDCLSEDNQRRIEGCSALIEDPTLDEIDKGLAYSRRALARSLQGDLEQALPDYDMAIKLDPRSSMTYNNRAWVMFRLNRIADGIRDAEAAVRLNPESHHAYDTRAHLNQSQGRKEEAFRDYERAMILGGKEVIKLYQCGLTSAGLYSGTVDGTFSRDLREALKACLEKDGCDPLPADEDCRAATS